VLFGGDMGIERAEANADPSCEPNGFSSNAGPQDEWVHR
jgi:hypothetical protein